MGGLRSISRKRRHLAVAIAIAVGAIFVPAPAQAGQIKASKAPQVSGPLSLADEKECLADKATYQGTTIARMNLCVWLYEFDEKMETDLTRTYGVAWVQTTVDAMNGWCATKVESNIKLPSGVKRHAYAPARKLSTKKRRRTTVKLTATANGNALDNGTVSQSFDLFPKTWTPSLANQGKTIRANWVGGESSKLAFAMGAEISWEFLSAPSIRGGLGNMRFVKSRRC